jgi:hypothetical protein
MVACAQQRCSCASQLAERWISCSISGSSGCVGEERKGYQAGASARHHHVTKSSNRIKPQPSPPLPPRPRS